MSEAGSTHTIIFGEKYEEKRPFGRPGRRWEDNIRMDVRETRWEGVDRVHLVQGRNHTGGLLSTR
jgi:hypothetical protein